MPVQWRGYTSCEMSSKKRPVGPKGGSYMFTSGGLVRIESYVSPEVKKALRKLAFEKDSSVSALVAQAIQDLLDRQRKPQK